MEKTAEQDEQIEALYRAYPKHKSKGRALRAIEKALKLCPFDVLMKAIQDYAEERKDKDPMFTPYPATWFNDMKWLDEKDAQEKNWRELEKEGF